MVDMTRSSPQPPGGGERASGTHATDLTTLLEASSRGDEDAFGAFYDATIPRVFGLILRVVRDRAQAEEVTQDVYHEVWLQSARFDPAQGSVPSWLFTIAHRRAVDRVRSAEAAGRRDTAYEARTRDVAYDRTAEAAERNVLAGRVRGALAGLAETQRRAVELAYYGGYTHTEGAAILDLPLGTAKTRIRDGLIRLRDTPGLLR